jgi:uncharacterized protein (TIGR03437 family)
MAIKRIAFILLGVAACSLWMAPAVSAQATPTASQFTVQMSEKGAKFRVDGYEHTTVAVFTWPAGSKHILEFAANNEDGRQYANAGRTRYTFNGWSDNQALSQNAGTPTRTAVTITADPTVNRYLGTVSVEHVIQLVMFEGRAIPPSTTPTTGPSSCESPGDAPANEFRIGVVVINGVCLWNNATFWVTGSDLRLSAYPFPGYVFIAWAVEGRSLDAYLRTATIDGPSIVQARFQPAKRVKFRSDPPGLKIRVDREEVRTTEVEPCEPNNFQPIRPPVNIPLACIGEFDFIPGSRHVLGGVSPQVDRFGRSWVFDRFSNGTPQDSVFTAGTDVVNIDTVTASFKRGVSTSVATKPAGLKVKINGRDNWPENYFVFLPGSVQTVSAPAEQNDARGRKYVFRRWSNGGPATQDVTIPENLDSTFQLVAEYDALAQLSIQSSAVGVSVMVDGEPCELPCRVNRPQGAQVRVDAPDTYQVSEAERWEFRKWSDGGARSRSVALNTQDTVSLTLAFQAAFKLVAAGDPPQGARISIDPPSADGFYLGDSTVLVAVDPQPGFKFRRWDLDLAGTSTIASLQMSRPRSVIARLDKVPFIQPAGIRNAAGVTPVGMVAPGSLIVIEGSELAPYFEEGPQGPILSQAIAKTSVLVGNRILPLLSVSPERIRAQLPRDLEIGEHELRVIRVGQADVVGRFTVSGSAPGLFSVPVDARDFAVATHANGSPVTSESPARKGETITFQGTGFGAYNMSHPEGFALPPAPAYTLAREVQVQAADQSRPAAWAGGVAGRVGIDAVRFKVPDEVPSGLTPVRVSVEGADSNTVILPIE